MLRPTNLARKASQCAFQWFQSHIDLLCDFWVGKGQREARG